MNTPLKEQTIQKQINQVSVAKLIDLWEETEHRPTTAELARVRGWLMEALEHKNPEAFNRWMSTEYKNPTDDMPRTYFLNA